MSESLERLIKHRQGKAPSNDDPEKNQQAAARKIPISGFSDDYMKRVLENARKPVLHPIIHRYDSHQRITPQPTSKHVSAMLPPTPKITRPTVNPIIGPSVNPIIGPSVNLYPEFSDDAMKRIAKFLSTPATDRYADCPDIIPGPLSKTEWSDKQPGKMKTIRLRHLPKDQLLKLARKTFQEIQGKMSEQTVGSLLVLAYNIMNDKGDYLTAESCYDLIDISSIIGLDEIPIFFSNSGCGKTVREIHEQNDTRLCMAYTYLAASYLRLFTKPAENYLKVGNYLKTSFQNFYSFVFPLENFHPDLNTIEFIRHRLEFKQTFKNTFYVFLYASCENTNGKNLKDFLYISHVSYTGLHCYTLFLKVMDALNKDNITLANRLYSKVFESELDVIMNVIIKLVKAKEGHDLQMWRFGRIFDSTFLSVLQPKCCVLFMLVLAFILIEKDPIGNKGVMDITQIKRANDGHKKMAFSYALRAIVLLEGNEALNHYA